MNKFIYLWVISLVFCSSIHAEDIPSNFSVKHHITSSSPFFILESLQEKPFGKLHVEEAEQQQVVFQYYDLCGGFLASAETHTLSNTENIKIHDANQRPIGTIQRIRRSFSPATYSLYDENSQLLAEGTMNWLNTRLVLCDPKNHHKEFLTLYRPYFWLAGDYWYVVLQKADKINPRLVVFLATYQSYLDCRNREIRPSAL